MIDDAALCVLAASAYVRPADYVCAGDVHVHLSTADTIPAVSFRGTVPTDVGDWCRDFAAVPLRLMTHWHLGPVHAGFLTGALAALPWLLERLPKATPFAITGHSLGGALALAAAALLCEAGQPPTLCTVFAAPRVGFDAFSACLANVPGRRYRFGNDPVPSVPTWPFAADRALTQIGWDMPSPLAAHAIARYAAALQAALPHDAIVSPVVQSGAQA